MQQAIFHWYLIFVCIPHKNLRCLFCVVSCLQGVRCFPYKHGNVAILHDLLVCKPEWFVGL
ncbi:Os01g0626500 [Oryza sativa Japonica Group]|uniref:Os01g0626500 protein n=1 Tax=Oryza sativa subsp. japonica TaxID=39947 RepID=A0A0P0V5G3_ORYSJ|nr:hypothetical protein EE612_004472 [Oryza sativa]BAS73256.1 Os01g0626500 [Oryza sativa Japonica Group]